MIWYAMIQTAIAFIGAFFAWLPNVNTLPWGIDGFLLTSISLVRRIGEVFPPIGILISFFLIYMGWRLTLLVVKLILGSRSPIHDAS